MQCENSQVINKRERERERKRDLVVCIEWRHQTSAGRTTDLALKNIDVSIIKVISHC